MERDSLHHLHGLQQHHFISNKGLLRAPPLSLLHSAPPIFSLQPPPPPPQPPLLPLPATLPRRSSSCPAIKNGTRKPRSAHGFTPKKSTKSFINNNIPKKEEKKTTEISSNTAKDDRVDMLQGSAVFAISPPPSSLPLPSFCLRPKLSCSEVAAGATDDLRRFLKLQ